MSNLKKKISIVIPCYNEENNIRKLYQRLKEAILKADCDYEIIFADNKSADNSRKILRELAADDFKVIALFFSRNFGHSQYGFTAGTEHATGDAVVWIDADLQDPPEIVYDFIKKWKEGYDVVYGTRKKRKGGLFFRFCYKLFYIIFRRLSYIDVPLDAGDFSLLDRKVADIINAMPERDRYMRGLRAWAGFKSIGIPYIRDERLNGVSSNNIIKNIKWAKKAIFSFSFVPLEFIFYFSFSFFVLTILASFAYLVIYIFYSAPPGFMTLLLAIFFLGSFQLLVLSIIAEYIGRIFEEVKGRPKYLIEEIISRK